MVQVNLCHGTGIMHQPPQVASMATADMNSGCMPECSNFSLVQNTHTSTWEASTHFQAVMVLTHTRPLSAGSLPESGDCWWGSPAGEWLPITRRWSKRGGEGSVENSLNKAQNLKWNGTNGMSISIKLGVSFTLLIYITHLLTSGECWERGEIHSHWTSEYQRMITSEIATIVLFDSQERVCTGARGHGHCSAWKACFQVVLIQHNKHCISTDKSCQHNFRLSHS